MPYREEPYHLQAESLGHIEGVSFASEAGPAAHYFGGLPYALPPIEEFRFRVPRRLPKGYRYGTAANPARFTGGTGICPQPPCRAPPERAHFDEDCLQLNIWIPSGSTPKHGWPVLVYYHGGFLQWGSANWRPVSLVPLLEDSAFRAILVLPSYRLNVFGFLASFELAAEAKANGEPFGNLGLWDQRAALEWTHQNIESFGGDPTNITISGYSAGGYSAFQQLGHELFCLPPEKTIIRRLAMWSNGPGVTPRSLQEQQIQFDELLQKLDVSPDLSAQEKLSKLRSVPYEMLMEVQAGMSIHEFRPVSDGVFYHPQLMEKINNGDFGRQMKERRIKLLNGECKDEHTVYRNWRTPDNSYDAVYGRLCAEYPESVASKLMVHYCGSSKDLPSGFADWQVLFGHMYADMQVHGLERGFHKALCKGGLVPGTDLLRYRFERRLDCIEEAFPASMGVTHSSDVPIWFWGAANFSGLLQKEKDLLKGWNEGFMAFVNGEEVAWGPSTATQVRRWRADGETDVWEDEMWKAGQDLWALVNQGS